MKTLQLFAVTAAGLIASATSQAELTWNFNFLDEGTGNFFDDGSVGAERKAAVQSTADILSSWFVNYDATLDIDIISKNIDDGTLMSATSEFESPGAIGFGNRGDVGVKILGGTDPNTGLRDGYVEVNFFDIDWNFTDTVPTDEFDFKSVMVHELIHAIGFSSSIASDGNDEWGGTDIGAPSNWKAFDQFMSDSTGALIDGTTFELDTARWNAASIGGTGSSGLFFNGENAVAANGGNAVNLYSPDPWENGSSGSHLDTDFFTSDVLIMEHEASEGARPRLLSAIEFGILKDIGFTNISAVPEPSTIVAIGIGGFLLFMLKRRRNAAQAQKAA